MVAPDDIILFESGEWSFWGDLSGFEAAQCETRDYTIIRFETAQWQELVRNETPNPYELRIRGEFNMSKTPKKVTFTDAKVGDRVWSITNGWGVVKERRSPHYHYPLNVEFEGGSCRLYTLWGRLHIEDQNPTLFWDEVKIETPEKPLPKLEVDAKVLVWGPDGKKYKRHFSHFDDEGRLFAFNFGHTRFTSECSPEVWVTAWDKWERAE